MTGLRFTEAFRLNNSLTLHISLSFSPLCDFWSETGVLMVAAGVKYIPWQVILHPEALAVALALNLRRPQLPRSLNKEEETHYSSSALAPCDVGNWHLGPASAQSPEWARTIWLHLATRPTPRNALPFATPRSLLLFDWSFPAATWGTSGMHLAWSTSPNCGTHP